MHTGGRGTELPEYCNLRVPEVSVRLGWDRSVFLLVHPRRPPRWMSYGRLGTEAIILVLDLS